jgi:Peptidase of plants and bacteria
MTIHFRNKHAMKYGEIIIKEFEKLKKYFDYEPGDIFIEVLPLNEFEKFYEFNYRHKPLPFIVGSALDNGIILILNKEDFTKRQGHSEDEFEQVILHEMAHMFIRRLTSPEHAFIWIQEGLCEYLSFKYSNFEIKNFIKFNEIENSEGWDKYNPYQQAGAFFKFLAQKYGDNKIVEFIKGLRENSMRQKEFFEEVFLTKFEEIEKDFSEKMQK